MQFLKQSTAFTAIIGPILDSAGAEYTGAVIGDLSISKNGTEAAMASAATLTHVSNGHYTLVGTTGNSDTLGRLGIRCNKVGYQVPPLRYIVVPANVFDSLVAGTDFLDVNTAEIGGSATAPLYLVTALNANGSIKATNLSLGALATQASVDTIDGIVDDILLDTAEIGAAGAGLTALATQASVNTIDGIVDDILVDTAVIGAAGAGLTALATQVSVNTIDGIVDDILVDTAAMPTVAQIESALLNEGDGQALLAAISAQVQTIFDGGADVPVSTLVSLVSAQITTDHGSGSYVRNTEPVDVSANVTLIKAKTDLIPASPAAVGSAMTLASSEDIYYADIQFTRDASNSQDEWTIRWYKNGTRVTSGITVPTLQVVKRANGTDLVASTTPSEIASTGAYKKDVSTAASRVSVGEAVEAIVAATIDGSSRTWSRIVGRDS